MADDSQASAVAAAADNGVSATRDDHQLQLVRSIPSLTDTTATFDDPSSGGSSLDCNDEEQEDYIA